MHVPLMAQHSHIGHPARLRVCLGSVSSVDFAVHTGSIESQFEICGHECGTSWT